MAPPALVVDDRRGRARPRGIGVWAFLLALMTAGALLHVGVRMKGIEVAYDLGRERKLNTELEEQRRRLHIEIGMLKDPGRVVALARDKLKMGPPLPGDILRGPPPARELATGTGTGTPTPASPSASSRPTGRRGSR
jgi:cell division protein FtsL